MTCGQLLTVICAWGFGLLVWSGGGRVSILHAQVDTSFEVKNVNQKDGELKLTFTLPFDGMFEIRVYDDFGNLATRNQYRSRKGTHTLTVKLYHMEKGSYSYELYYKGHHHHGEFDYQ